VRSKGCLSNKTALAMIFKLAEAAEKSWRRLDDHNQLPKIILGVSFTDGMKIQWQVIKGRRLCKSLYFQISRFFPPMEETAPEFSVFAKL
jgi:hypothetical protein